MKKIYIIYAVLKDTEQTYQIVFVINVKYIQSKCIFGFDFHPL